MSCCVVHSAVGWAVTPKCTIRRRSWESMRKTNSNRKVAVGTTKKSVETISRMWFFRNVFQDFSLQGRSGTQTASQRRKQEEENIKHGEERRLQAAVIKFN